MGVCAVKIWVALLPMHWLVARELFPPSRESFLRISSNASCNGSSNPLSMQAEIPEMSRAEFESSMLVSTWKNSSQSHERIGLWEADHSAGQMSGHSEREYSYMQWRSSSKRRRSSVWTAFSQPQNSIRSAFAVDSDRRKKTFGHNAASSGKSILHRLPNATVKVQKRVWKLWRIWCLFDAYLHAISIMAGRSKLTWKCRGFWRIHGISVSHFRNSDSCLCRNGADRISRAGTSSFSIEWLISPSWRKVWSFPKLVTLDNGISISTQSIQLWGIQKNSVSLGTWFK